MEARLNSAKTESRSPRGFLPRPLLLRLRHPNSGKKESAEVLRNPFPRKLFPQNFVRIVSDFLVWIHFKKGSNFVQKIPQILPLKSSN